MKHLLITLFIGPRQILLPVIMLYSFKMVLTGCFMQVKASHLRLAFRQMPVVVFMPKLVTVLLNLFRVGAIKKAIYK